MYKIISTTARTELQEQINHLEINGFSLVHFSVVTSIRNDSNYTAVMHKPDAAPSPFMTANDFLAAMDASVEIVQSMADHADEVLREEARQYGTGQ